MSFADIANEVLAEIGLTPPIMYAGNADILAQRVIACANAEGRFLANEHDWSILHREYEFQTANGVDNYALPEDWARQIRNTAWDRSSFWSMRGGKTPQQWQRLVSSLVETPALRRKFRLLDGPLQGSILLFPTPTQDGEELVIEYVSKFWCQDAQGDGKAAITADDDEIRLSHEVFHLGLLWRVRRAQGMSHAEERLDAERALGKAIKADIALPKINIARSGDFHLHANVPDSDFPGPMQ